MRRVLEPDAFTTWVDGYFPDVTVAPYDSILEPVEDAPEGGVALHLVGLDIAKAWCLAGIASALDGHQLVHIFEESATRHAEVGLERAFSSEDYAGTHWLSSFALYLISRNDGGVAPT